MNPIQVSALFGLMFCLSALSGSATLPLTGQWACRLDPEDKSLAEDWAQPLVTEGQTELPSTTYIRGIGPVNSEANQFQLTIAYKYLGAFWFEREIKIPSVWAGQAVTLECGVYVSNDSRARGDTVASVQWQNSDQWQVLQFKQANRRAAYRWWSNPPSAMRATLTWPSSMSSLHHHDG